LYGSCEKEPYIGSKQGLLGSRFARMRGALPVEGCRAGAAIRSFQLPVLMVVAALVIAPPIAVARVPAAVTTTRAMSHSSTAYSAVEALSSPLAIFVAKADILFLAVLIMQTT